MHRPGEGGVVVLLQSNPADMRVVVLIQCNPAGVNSNHEKRAACCPTSHLVIMGELRDRFDLPKKEKSV